MWPASRLFSHQGSCGMMLAAIALYQTLMIEEGALPRTERGLLEVVVKGRMGITDRGAADDSF